LKKSIINVKLLQGPILLYCNIQNNSDCGRFNDGTESLSIVHTILLIKAGDVNDGLKPTGYPKPTKKFKSIDLLFLKKKTQA